MSTPRARASLLLCASLSAAAACKRSGPPSAGASPTVVAVAALAPEPDDVVDPAARDRADDAALVAASNALGFALFARLRAEPRNLVLSPVAAAEALSLARAGARGATEAQLARALGALPAGRHERAWARLRAALGPQPAAAPGAGAGAGAASAAVAARLFGPQGNAFREDFSALAREGYGAAPAALDFAQAPEAGRLAVNAWASGESDGRVRELLPAGTVSPTTRLVLASVARVRAEWARPFDRRRSAGALAFTLRPGEQVPAPAMRQALELRVGGVPGATAFELPFAGAAWSLLIVVPNEPDGLAALEAALSVDALSALDASAHTETLTVVLPRFSVTSSEGLTAPVSALGAPMAFTPEADFSAAVSGPAHIDQAVHAATLTVREGGADSAPPPPPPATAGAPAADSGAAEPVEPPPELRADRPFVFLLRDATTGAIVLLGRVLDPRR